MSYIQDDSVVTKQGTTYGSAQDKIMQAVQLNKFLVCQRITGIVFAIIFTSVLWSCSDEDGCLFSRSASCGFAAFLGITSATVDSILLAVIFLPSICGVESCLGRWVSLQYGIAAMFAILWFPCALDLSVGFASWCSDVKDEQGDVNNCWLDARYKPMYTAVIFAWLQAGLWLSTLMWCYYEYKMIERASKMHASNTLDEDPEIAQYQSTAVLRDGDELRF